MYILAPLLEKQDVLIMILFVYLYLFKTFCLFALFCIQKIDEEIDFFYIEEIGCLFLIYLDTFFVYKRNQ